MFMVSTAHYVLNWVLMVVNNTKYQDLADFILVGTIGGTGDVGPGFASTYRSGDTLGPRLSTAQQYTPIINVCPYLPISV